MNPIRFCLEVYVENSTDTVRRGHVTLERVMPGLSFLPPKGTDIMSLKGLEDTPLILVTSDISLFSGDGGFEWDITIVDKNVEKGKIPTLTAEEVQKALDAGWKLN